MTALSKTGSTLYIGNKTYSSWSLRGWLALRAAGFAFDEVVIPLDQPDTTAKIGAVTPAGRVPVLRLGDGTLIWDSCAIMEMAAEAAPEAGLWPADPLARAVARSAVAEMHAGFVSLRKSMPMDLKRKKPGEGQTPETLADIQRITSLWADLRRRFGGADGPFLFGRFGNADIAYAPVVTRLNTYAPPMDAGAAAYVSAVLAHPLMAEWTTAALAEPWVLENP